MWTFVTAAVFLKGNTSAIKCSYVDMYIYVCIYIYIYLFVYIYIYIYISSYK